MAMQIGFSRVLLLAGAGYTSSILARNGKLSDVLAELQALLKGSGEQEGDSDKIVSQMYNRLLEEIHSSRQTVVLNKNGGACSQGNLASLIVLGAVGYGYMWWKGLNFSDLMYVTKRSVAAAVTNMTKSLDIVKEAAENTKKHLTQRVQNLDDKVLVQKELSEKIKDDVAGVQGSLTGLDSDISQLKIKLSGLEKKLRSLGEKEDIANMDIAYLCKVIQQMPEALQEQLTLQDHAPRGRLLSYPEQGMMMGLKEILQDNFTKLEEPPKNLLMRPVSTN